MKTVLSPSALVASVLFQVSAAIAAPDLPALWAERVKCVVAVEYMTVTETERRPTVSMGTVVDAAGTIILQSSAVDPRAALWQLKDFKVYLAGQGEGAPAEYLGQDAFTGWHFVRAGEGTKSRLTPVTAFAGESGPRKPAIAEAVWGIGLRPKDEDFTPYILQSRVALLQAVPQLTGIAQHEVAAPGLPVAVPAGRASAPAQKTASRSIMVSPWRARAGHRRREVQARHRRCPRA